MRSQKKIYKKVKKSKGIKLRNNKFRSLKGGQRRKYKSKKNKGGGIINTFKDKVGLKKSYKEINGIPFCEYAKDKKNGEKFKFDDLLKSEKNCYVYLHDPALYRDRGRGWITKEHLEDKDPNGSPWSVQSADDDRYMYVPNGEELKNLSKERNLVHVDPLDLKFNLRNRKICVPKLDKSVKGSFRYKYGFKDGTMFNEREERIQKQGQAPWTTDQAPKKPDEIRVVQNHETGGWSPTSPGQTKVWISDSDRLGLKPITCTLPNKWDKKYVTAALRDKAGTLKEPKPNLFTNYNEECWSECKKIVETRRKPVHKCTSDEQCPCPDLGWEKGKECTYPKTNKRCRNIRDKNGNDPNGTTCVILKEEDDILPYGSC